MKKNVTKIFDRLQLVYIGVVRCHRGVLGRSGARRGKLPGLEQAENGRNGCTNHSAVGPVPSREPDPLALRQPLGNVFETPRWHYRQKVYATPKNVFSLTEWCCVAKKKRCSGFCALAPTISSCFLDPGRRCYGWPLRCSGVVTGAGSAGGRLRCLMRCAPAPAQSGGNRVGSQALSLDSLLLLTAFHRARSKLKKAGPGGP